MKTITLFIVLFFVFTNVQPQTKTVLTGDRGIFRYESSYNWHTKKEIISFSIMHKNGTSEYETVFAEMTTKTTVSFLNPELKGLSSKNLSILNGKEVLVVCKLKQKGVGEGSEVYCEDLKVLLIQE